MARNIGSVAIAAWRFFKANTPKLFLLLAVVVLSAAIALPLLSISAGEDAIAVTAATSSGFAAAAAVLAAVWQFSEQHLHARSKFALDMAMEGVQRAHAIIGEQNPTSRIAWINAARVMSRALKTADNVSASDHRDAWELFREEWRIRFYYHLLHSPEFYFGLPEPETYSSLNAHYPDEAVRELMRRQIINSSTSTTGRTSEGTSLRMLDTTSIKVFYDFAQYPANYDDPMNAERFSEADLRRVERDMFGLAVFLRASQRFHTIGTQVIEYPSHAQE